jgi:hypothetical protein
MNREEKELLLKDLSARLPYEVRCKWTSDDGIYTGGGVLYDVCKVKTSSGYEYWDCYFEDENDDIPIEIVRPYLRPLSLMSDEEREEYNALYYEAPIYRDNGNSWRDSRVLESLHTDWYNAHHFDYRGLIPKGLAIEVTEQYNPYK